MCTTHFRTYFSGDWDVHWGYRILTHGQMTNSPFTGRSLAVAEAGGNPSFPKPGLVTNIDLQVGDGGCLQVTKGLCLRLNQRKFRRKLPSYGN